MPVRRLSWSGSYKLHLCLKNQVKTILDKMSSFQLFSAGLNHSVWLPGPNIKVLIEFWALPLCAVSGFCLLSVKENAREVQQVLVIWQQTEWKQNNWNCICAFMQHWRQEHNILRVWLQKKRQKKRQVRVFETDSISWLGSQGEQVLCLIHCWFCIFFPLARHVEVCNFYHRCS